MQRISAQVISYSFIVALGGFVFGFDASVISGTVSFITEQFSLTPWQQGFVVSAPSLGALLAMFFAGALSDRYGRKRILITVSIIYLISAIASAFAVNFSMLAGARLIGGLAFCSLMIAPLYIAEISTPEHRGKLVSINQFNIVIGLSASYFTNYWLLLLSQTPDSWLLNVTSAENVWRWMLGLEIVPALLWSVLLLKVVETPRWLMTQNRYKEAEFSAKKLDISDVVTFMQNVRLSLHQNHLSIREKIRIIISPKLRLPLIVGLVIGVVQQLTGINVIFFYAPTIFEQSGIGTDTAFIQAIWVGLINVIFTIVAVWAIDEFGRKPLLLFGLGGIVISMSLCAYGFQDPDALNPRLILFAILMFVASFAMSLGPVMWVLFSEIFPNHIRGIAISIVTVVNSLCSFLVQLIFPWELSNFGPVITFLSYAVVAAIGLIFVLFFLPETKGKSLEAIANELSR
jgi:sugar porter (SP) family MFS transporter